MYFQARVDRSNNITLSWEASCTVIDQPIGYIVTYKDMKNGKTSYASYSKTVNTQLSKEFDTGIKYGTEYEFSVSVDVPNARGSNMVRIKSIQLPVPEGLYSYPNVNTSVHEIAWRAPQKLPTYLKNGNKIKYRYVFFKVFNGLC